MQSPESEFIDEASFQPELQACFFCVVVFCVTSYMDGVIYVYIAGRLYELWGLSSFDRGWIE